MERLVLVLILLLAPHAKLPAVDWVYPIRPADLLLISSALVFIRCMPRKRRLSVAVPEMLLVFCIAVASVFWGYYNFNLVDFVAVEESGKLITYFSVAVKKLLLISICFLGFQFIIGSPSLSNGLILKYWQRGLWVAVVLHALTYVVTGDYFTVRAGVFVEGNHGGSYYLLSFFLMWYATQQNLRFGLSGMLLALAGIALTQSTTALVLLLPLAAVAYVSLSSHTRKLTLRGFVSQLLILVVVSSVFFVFGSELLNKLTTEEINPGSFSRYDRLASINSGINMFLEHPVFGVGIQGYAFALPQFVDPFIDGFFDWDSRRIANNIYVELLAEQGGIGLMAMLLVMYRICRPIVRSFRRGALLVAGAASILLSWLAFPTYTVSFHWIGLAVLVRLAVQGIGVHALYHRPATNVNANCSGYSHPTRTRLDVL